jgi:hypothetical protein
MNARQESPAQRALAASATALAVAVTCLLTFMPSLFERFLVTPLRIVAVSLLLATALILHWAFLGIGVRRLGRSLLGWLTLAVLLVPIGGAAALILLSWLSDEAPTPLPAR